MAANVKQVSHKLPAEKFRGSVIVKLRLRQMVRSFVMAITALYRD